MNQDQMMVTALRMLSIDAVQQANSGHPGLPLGAAPMAYALWNRTLRIDPDNLTWPDRDRFILSAGHGSAMLYALLYLHGYEVSLDDLRDFRQLDSITPGHPEYHDTPGVEATTGPLGHGFAMGVGMAMAEAHLEAVFTDGDESLFNHHTYVLASDGDLMEGVSNEAASLAGTLALKKLIVLYDSNDISIEGSTDLAFTENVRGRFEALNWNTLLVPDGNSLDAIDAAIQEAKKSDKPTLIEIRTEIGYGSPRAGSEKSHGEPLGAENIELTRKEFGWTHEPFVVPEEVTEYTAEYKKNAKAHVEKWEEKKARMFEKNPALAEKYKAYFEEENFTMPEVAFEKPLASRETSFIVLNKVAEVLPNLIGGSADLGPSNKSVMKDRAYMSPADYSGSNLHFGVREHAMTAISNGLALHGGLRPYCSTFLIFSDFMKPAIRLAAIMRLPVTYILTHDSIGVGEDGPTHQPIEQLAMLRSIPNMTVYRPADGKETVHAWEYALNHKTGPTALVLSRQNLPQLEETGADALKGGYIIKACDSPDVLLIATGSELSITMEAETKLAEKGVSAQVVSIPSWEVFQAQDKAYRDQVLPPAVTRRVGVEAASEFGWGRYLGLDGAFVGMKSFGASGPGNAVYEKFGITVDAIVESALGLLEQE